MRPRILACAAVLGCAHLPQLPDACPPYAERCNGAVIERCEGGRWQPSVHCPEVSLNSRCIMDPDGSGAGACVGP